MRFTQIPQQLDQTLAKEWEQFTEEQKIQISEAVLNLSKHFQHPEGRVTPWSDPNIRLGYRFYFFPLNLARGLSLMKSLDQLVDSPFSSLFDIGAGFGNLKFLQQESLYLLDGTVTEVEQSRSPLTSALKEIPINIPEKSTAFFSFSWVEMKTPIQTLNQFEHLIFLEPSTSVVARKLMSLRQELIDCGYTILAPCTHLKNCPLLTQSKTDWCHDRVHFEKPEWFKDLENRLPMKNDTLTYSYLVASKTKAQTSHGYTRVIGDTLKEKGKTRQAICFDDQRRFLSWLKRDHKNPEALDHGSLIAFENAEEKASELRVTPLTRISKFELSHRAETRPSAHQE